MKNDYIVSVNIGLISLIKLKDKRHGLKEVEERKHMRETILWAMSPKDTKVWCRRKNEKRWLLQKSPSWLECNEYIVDNEDAIERMRLFEEQECLNQ